MNTGTPNIKQKLASSINWAVQNGAHVLSNSWGHNALVSSYIDGAITNAINNGRNGLGCIVVFSTGNDNGAVLYPANSNPNILAVGAISECGQRKSLTSCDGESWGSNFGTTLDVVAPGVLIPTTDRTGTNGYNTNLAIHPLNGGTRITTDYTNNDYTVWFNGTSSACPHVAGVAALILSVNPSLTGQQVRDIIEQTAQKTGGYNYATTTGRTNGTWHNQMGYGLVNALCAVTRAQMSLATISGPSYVCTNAEVSFTVNDAPPNYSWDHSDNLVPVNGNPGTFTTLFLKGDAWVSISTYGVEVGRKEFVIGSEVTGIEQISYAGKNRYYASPACTGELDNMWILEWQGMDLLVDKPDTVYGRNYVDVISTTDPNNMTIATLTLKQGGYTYTKYISVMGVHIGLDGIHLPPPFPFDPILTFSPNPATSETVISIEQGSSEESSLKSASTETTFDENAEWYLEVYDNMQGLKLKKQKLKGKNTTINTQSWKEGVYMVRVKYKGEILTGKLIVK